MNTLKAEKRSMDVKAKKLRREGYVTGNLFGREIQGSIPVKMDKKDVEALLKTNGKGSQVMLELEGKSYDALIKDVVYNAMTHYVDEIDFQALVSNVKVHSVAEVVLVNHDKITEGVVQEMLTEISYKALPAALVDKVRIDIGSMRIGDSIRVKDLEIAGNPDIDLMTDPEAVVVEVTLPHNAPVPETTTEEAPAEE